MLSLTEAVKTAERCQRNWDYDNPVSPIDIQKIVEVATTMPTKQNRKFYELIVSSNPEFNKICYTHAIDPNNPHFTNRKIHRNTQANAPLIMMWRTVDQTKVEASDPFKDEYTKNYFTSVGISSGAAVLTANALGYRTGYCNCLDYDNLMNELEQKFNILRDNGAPVLEAMIVGIGMPDTNFSRIECVVDGELGYTAETVNKSIDVTYIN